MPFANGMLAAALVFVLCTSVIFAELSRGNTDIFAEQLVEMALRIKPDHAGDLCDGVVRCDQQGLRFADLFAQRILHGRATDHVLKHV